MPNTDANSDGALIVGFVAIVAAITLLGQLAELFFELTHSLPAEQSVFNCARLNALLWILIQLACNEARLAPSRWARAWWV